MPTKDTPDAPPPDEAEEPAEDLDALNQRIADEAAEATTADKRNPKT